MDLTLQLHSPGMTALHRAGLGGLAATLRALEKNVRESLTKFPDDKCPGAPWPDGKPPWEIEAHQITLHLGDKPAAFLASLFSYAFQTPEADHSLAYLPGQWGGVKSMEPDRIAVRVALQEGHLNVFQQPDRSWSKTAEQTLSYEPEEGKPLVLRFKNPTKLKHASFWQELLEGATPADKIRKNKFAKNIEIKSHHSPGSGERHVKAGPIAQIKVSPENAIPLMFAPAGCLTLLASYQEGVFIVPDVIDLLLFAASRRYLTPQTSRDCHIGSAADAVLQAQVRLRLAPELEDTGVSGFEAYALRQMAGSGIRKARVASYTIHAADTAALAKFEIALRCLPPRLKVFERKKPKKEELPVEAFWADSVVRPLVAENLALGLPWYQGFTRLMTALDDRNRPLRDAVGYEKSQLHELIKAMPNDHSGETRLIESVHAAMRSRYGQIASDNEGNPVAMKNRFKGEYERLRLALAGAKTPDTFRNSLCDLFARAGRSDPLQNHWQELLPLLRDDRWQLTRDLSLLALASYKGKGAETLAAPDAPDEEAA